MTEPNGRIWGGRQFGIEELPDGRIIARATAPSEAFTRALEESQANVVYLEGRGLPTICHA